MNHSVYCIYRLALITLLAMSAGACSTASFKHESLNSFQVEQRAVTQEQGPIRVRASVPGRDEAEKIFGIPIYKRGIQPVWLEITNNSPGRARLTLVSVDHDYFSPFEVAYMHKKHFSKAGWQEMEKYLLEMAMPRIIAAGEKASGFVFTHATDGTKSFNVDVFYQGTKAIYEAFAFPDLCRTTPKSISRACTRTGLYLILIQTDCELPCRTCLAAPATGTALDRVRQSTWFLWQRECPC
jgi:hypothetical protein